MFTVRLQYAKPCIMDDEKLSISQRQSEVDALYRLGIKYTGQHHAGSIFSWFFLYYLKYTQPFIYIYTYIYEPTK